MEPNQSTNKKFLVIITIAIVLVVAGIFLLTRSTAVVPQEAEVSTPVKIFTTEAEKMQYLADVASSTSVDTPTQTAAKLKILENIAKETPKDTPAETAAKLDILQAIADKANQ